MRKSPKNPELTLEQAVGEISDLSPAEIAKMMKRLGVHGRPCTTYACPLARLMKINFGGNFVVGKKYIMRISGRREDKIATPERLKEFIQAYDLGRFPELIEPPPRAFGKRKRPKPTGRKRVIHHHPSLEVGR